MQTERGKLMPIDAEPAANGNLVKDGETQRAVRGQVQFLPTVRVVKRDDPEVEGRLRYISHFATCPNAQRFKKAR